MSYSYKHIQVKPITGRIGAEIEGVELSSKLDEQVIYEINQALLQYKAIFFKAQHHLDDVEQEAFAARLGTPLNHPTVPVKNGSKHILELDSSHGVRADSWHTDITFLDAYPKASILRSIVAPAAGGDTAWANTTSAYDSLPEPLKALADKLRTVHSNDFDYANTDLTINKETLAKYRNFFKSTEYETEHPLVRVHPETGEKTLLLGHFFKRFVGFNSTDSKKLFDLFQSHIVKQENIVRWRWEAGDVAIWDNRATQHRAINDYGDQRRIVRRVTLEGDIPVGVDGRPSLTQHKEEKFDIKDYRQTETGIYEKVS
ncbi:TauD/TfdA family dioxygenase [Acinetobacter sp. Marseille-Q1618]|uniref:TauD/TfdA dioxygenase family protein n=1 Tax=Acinetobacter sp. Marseille-Q1618 TaxID=2697502 RepID=UPI00156F5152|nr:TauD/TfdA family dioxygenase [Acinetobacter sp. Marseille-Q1618]